VLDAEGDAQAMELRAAAEKVRLEKVGEGEGEAARKRLGGIKAADADQNVLTIEYLTALARIGDGRATKLVIPAEFSGLLGMLAAFVETTRPEDRDELQPRGGLPVPKDDERVELPRADAP
jgi:regulator of protease activity HflC (stomatin/prohibitin superfamily)